MRLITSIFGKVSNADHVHVQGTTVTNAKVGATTAEALVHSEDTPGRGTASGNGNEDQNTRVEAKNDFDSDPPLNNNRNSSPATTTISSRFIKYQYILTLRQQSQQSSAA